MELPVHQVLAPVDRTPGKVFERRSDDVKVLPDVYHAGIGIEPRDDGVAVAEFSHAGRVRESVVLLFVYDETSLVQ